MNVKERLRNLAKAVKREREIDTKAVERAKEYIRRIKETAKTH